MRKITLLMAAFFVAVGMNAQIFEEDFELGLGDWQVISNSGDAIWKAANEAFPNLSSSPWGAGPLQFSSTIALIDDDADGPTGNDNSSLVSPVINLAGATNATLSFDYFNVVFELDTSLTVEVFDGSNWNEVFFVLGDAANTSGDPDDMFLNEVLDVTPYANANFQIRFTYDDGGDWSFGAAVDNIVVDGTLSLSESNIKGFNYSFSPQTQNLTISASEAFSNISIFNVLGQQVVNKNLSSTNEVINLSSIKSGVYIVNVTANGQTTTFKLAKR